ncbi:Zn-dependent exopeptidase [Jaminaea rosea]|uniref:Inactive metallocarboxypeptidase ECM14 n=1 Tax=Jaminaea rosea TaxID=1569628 RepID=A0A316UQP9_9BASI|nr:Zn-dependent exopeptidase [Jaminaea rosea]PWN25445.1 Zn-dependent exopeptidase [Jaminaea rosea]
MGGTTRGVEDHFHNGYHNLANITAWLSWQVFQNPSLAELVELGTTYQEKVIQGIRIGRDAGRGKREVVIVGGAHGREWITTSTCLYLISHLLSASPSTPGSASHLDKFSFLIIPVLNPDGYEHTWGRGSDRFWRKNLQPTGSHDWLGRECKGLDVSRNFPVHFSASSSLTGSGCDSTYPGQEALSSSEARALASYLSRSGEEGEEVLSFIDLHSYGQLILYPWLSCASASSDGYASDNATAATTTTAPPIPDEEDMAELTLGAARAAKLVHNKVYRAGRGCEVMYSQEGSAVDFAYTARRGSAQGGDGGAGIKWSFEVELRDEGSWGFLLPPGQVRDTGEEMAALLDYLLAFVAGKERL